MKAVPTPGRRRTIAMRITLRENGLILDILVTSDGDVRLLNLSPKELPDPEDSRWFRLLELQLSGQNQDDNCGSKHTGTQPGSLLRYAAAITGSLVLVTGLAFATIHLVRSGSAPSADKSRTTATAPDSSRRTVPQTLPIKVAPAKHAPVIFQNVTLESILQQVSKTYGCQVTYRNDAARNIRLYLQWDEKDSLDDFIGKINHFEKVHISRSENTLTVE